MFIFKEKPMQCIDKDMYDDIICDSVVGASKELAKAIEKGQKKLKTFDWLARDIFNGLYKSNVQQLQPNEVNPLAKLNFAEVEKFLESSTYQELRQHTYLNEFGSGLGCKTICQELLQRFEQDEQLKEAIDKINKMMQKYDGDGKSKGKGQGQQQGGNQGQPQDDQDGNGQGDQPGDGQQPQPDIDPQDAKELEEAINGVQGALRRAISGAGQKALEEAEENSDILSGWGLEGGEYQRIPFSDKLKMLEKIKQSSRLQQVSKLVGRLRHIANGTRQIKLEHAKVEPFSITLGNDIPHLLPTELVRMKNKTLKRQFMRDFVEGNLLQYDMKSKEHVGKGEILALIDGSGSMTDYWNGSTRDGWAKAVALGLLEIAVKERRTFGYCNFGSRSELISGIFEKGKTTPDDLIKLAESFWGGGTDFEYPLRWAVKQIETSTFKKADIVMITDGACGVSNSFVQEIKKLKEEKEFRIYMILIGQTKESVMRSGDWSWVDDWTDDLNADTSKELFVQI